MDASHGTSPPLPHQGGHKEGCPRSQDDRIAAGHVANRETKAGKEAELVPASQSQQHTADRQNHTLHHPCSGRPLGTGCIRCGQLQLGKSLARTGAAWDRIRVSLRSEVSLAGHSGLGLPIAYVQRTGLRGCPPQCGGWVASPRLLGHICKRGISPPPTGPSGTALALPSDSQLCQSLSDDDY